MPPATHAIHYTLTDLKVAALDATGTPGALVDVPGIRSLEVSIPNDAVELRGDNRVIAVVDQGNGLEWSAEEAGFGFAALEVILGATVTDAGVTPNATRRLDIADTDARPYFAMVGVSPSDDGAADMHVIVWKAKATGAYSFTLSDQEFVTPSLEGRGIGRASDGLLFSAIQNETATAAAIPADTP